MAKRLNADCHVTGFCANEKNSLGMKKIHVAAQRADFAVVLLRISILTRRN